MYDQQSPAGALIIDGTRCSSCIHHKVCFFRIEGKRPGLQKKRVEAFGTTFTKAQCEHFRAE